MRSFRKLVVASIVLLCASTYLTLYTFRAHTVAMHIYEDTESGTIYWRSGSAGSFFPWPEEPGLLEIIVKAEGTDLFIYIYLIRTWLLTGLSVLLWLITGIFIISSQRKTL